MGEMICCIGCGREYPATTEWFTRATDSRYFYKRCRSCMREARRQKLAAMDAGALAALRAKNNARTTAWKAANPKTAKSSERKSNAASYVRHREKRKAESAKYVADHPADAETKRRRHADYYQRNRSTIAVRTKAYREANPERVRVAMDRARIKRWAYYLLRNALANTRRTRVGTIVTLTEDDILAMYERQGGRCYWFGIPLAPTKLPRDPYQPSLDRLDTSLGYVAGNVVPACHAANMARSVATVERFQQFLKDLKMNLLAKTE